MSSEQSWLSVLRESMNSSILFSEYCYCEDKEAVYWSLKLFLWKVYDIHKNGRYCTWANRGGVNSQIASHGRVCRSVEIHNPIMHSKRLSLWHTVRLVANDMLNRKKSEDVWPPKAYDTRSDTSYTMVSNGVLGDDTRSDILRFFRIQHVVCDKSNRVS